MGAKRRVEVAIVLAVTLGMSAVRAVLQLVGALTRGPLNTQETTLNAPQASQAWLDIALQLTSAATLIAWGLLVWYLLGELPRPRWADVVPALALAAVIGIPGLALYAGALRMGWTTEVVIADGFLLTQLMWAFANGFAEESIVVAYLQRRFGRAALLPAALLRGAYHLYQGVSAFFGNLVMGLLYGLYYAKTGRIWPLIIAHCVIDAVAFVGYRFWPF
ncbi:MAG: CPBP family intramembrane glutamic endopeptidase [Corynebacterium sp.]|nr:CPBP family intramembrane glutamic endopeptidase [Corynebacterium sp.]